MVYGGWEGHTPRESTELFAAELEARDFHVTVRDTLDPYDDPVFLASLDLVVQCWTLGKLSPERERTLCDAVAAGTGFAGWHGGILDAFRESTDYQFLTGGQWVAHPGGCVPAYRVERTDARHPVCRDIPAFTLENTEQYYCHVDPGVHVLYTTTFFGPEDPVHPVPAGAKVPYAWTRSFGKGRVFAACWGHTVEDFRTPEAREIVARGLVWAARGAEEVP